MPKPLTLQVSIKVVKDWSGVADADLEVPLNSDAKLVGQLVADLIPDVIAEAQRELAKREASALAEATAVEV